jgi:hypothetical protein
MQVIKPGVLNFMANIVYPMVGICVKVMSKI